MPSRPPGASSRGILRLCTSRTHTAPNLRFYTFDPAQRTCPTCTQRITAAQLAATRSEYAPPPPIDPDDIPF